MAASAAEGPGPSPRLAGEAGHALSEPVPRGRSGHLAHVPSTVATGKGRQGAGFGKSCSLGVLVCSGVGLTDLRGEVGPLLGILTKALSGLLPATSPGLPWGQCVGSLGSATGTLGFAVLAPHLAPHLLREQGR